MALFPYCAECSKTLSEISFLICIFNTSWLSVLLKREFPMELPKVEFLTAIGVRSCLPDGAREGHEARSSNGWLQGYLLIQEILSATRTDCLVMTKSSSHAAFRWKWDVFSGAEAFLFDCVWFVRLDEGGFGFGFLCFWGLANSGDSFWP